MAVQEKLIIDGLDTNDGVNFTIESLTFQPAEKKPLWASNADADGDLLIDEPHYGNAVFTARIRVEPQASTDLAIAKLGQLTDKLQRAARYRDVGGLPMVWTPAGSTRSLTWYILLGEHSEIPTDMQGDNAGWFIAAPIVTVKLTCRSFGYGDWVTALAAVSSTLPLQSAYFSNPGDVAAEAVLTVADAATQDRRYLEWGIDQVAGPAATNLLSNPSAQTNTTGWTSTTDSVYLGGTGTLSRITNVLYTGFAGETGLQVLTGGANQGLRLSSNLTVTNGTVYTLSFYAKGAVGGEQITGYLGTPTNSSSSNVAATLTTSWQRFTVTWTASGTTAMAAIKIAASGATVQFFGLQVEAASAATAYIDGDQADCFWTGTRGASTSTRGASLIIDSDDVTLVGGAQTTQAGAYDPNATGNNVVSMTAINVPATMVASPDTALVGTFRVKARFYLADLNGRVRVSYRTGDGPVQSNSFKTPVVSGAWHEIDLGEISLDAVTRGPQRSVIYIDAKSVSGTSVVKWDHLQLIPSRRYGKARGIVPASASSTIAGFDGFNQAGSPNLSGATPDIGSAWSGAGSANDWTVDSTNAWARRTAVSDTAGTGRREFLGGTQSAVSLYGEFASTGPLFLIQHLGLVVRYVNATNWATLTITNNGALRLRKSIAGTVTSIWAYGSFRPTAQSLTSLPLAVSVSADGVWAVSAAGAQLATGTDADFATGGTLASGSQGIYDEYTSAIAQTRTADNVSVYVPPVAGRVVYSGQSIDIDSASTQRRDAAGLNRGEPVFYRGSRFYVDPSGDDGRVSRLAVKMRRVDVDREADANIADNQTIAVSVRPRYLLPR